MALEGSIDGALKQSGVERAIQGKSDCEVVGGGAGPELLSEPDAALSDRERRAGGTSDSCLPPRHLTPLSVVASISFPFRGVKNSQGPTLVIRAPIASRRPPGIES